jgi:precorrin-2 dehydrogenase/sirohydrochlorin ferrochelatase
MRAAPHAFYPATLDLGGATVVVIGAGAVALRKLRGLPKGLKRVGIVAPEISGAVRSWARSRPEAKLVRRGFERGDLKDCRLLFCCTDDPETNASAARLARAKGIWVCQTSRPEEGDVQVPAVVRAGGLHLTLSTGGSSPALAKALRAHFEATLNASDLRWFLRQLEVRRTKMKSDPGYKARLLKRLLAPGVLSGILAPRSVAGRRRLQSLLNP